MLHTLLLALILSLCALPGAQAEPIGSMDENASQVELWFFWTSTCPHCKAARPFIDQLSARTPWLRVHSYELFASLEARALFSRKAHEAGVEASSVPAFFFCGQALFGFDNPESIGALLSDALQRCHRQTSASDEHAAELASPTDTLTTAQLEQRLGFAVGDLSLPLLTLVIAGLDAFNPCAFFVLLFLLSLLVHARNRRRMLLIGGVFVFFSGLLYFLFMAAWLNLFLLIGQLRVVTLVAGGIAVLMALLNLRDAWQARAQATLAIPAEAKPGLFARMRGLLQADHLPTLLLGTVALALAANSYELLCTAGFPMLYTRILTLQGLESSGYYLYLLLYNLVYVVPLIVIVLLFTWSMGSRKLQEHEGQTLKVLSGLMMLGLGGVLLFAPGLLDNLLTALLLLVVAVFGSWLFARFRGNRS